MTTTLDPTSNEILTGVHSVDNYPYGRLQCTMSFSVEFVKGKGYRNVMQSINPKNKRLNKPKKSTYSNFMYMVKDENGHIKFKAHSFYDYDSISKFMEVVKKYDFSYLTEEQVKDLYAMVITCLKGNARYFESNEVTTMEQFLQVLKVKEFFELYKHSESINDILSVNYDINLINRLKG